MAVKIDFSAIEDSPLADVPRTRPQTEGPVRDDPFFDVTAEVEPTVISLRSPRPVALPRRGQLSLLAAALLICLGALIGDRFEFADDGKASQLPAYQVDLNSSNLEELVLLKGIGEVTAEKILWEREENGPFRDKDDLQRVKGIGPKTLDRLRDQVICR